MSFFPRFRLLCSFLRSFHFEFLDLRSFFFSLLLRAISLTEEGTKKGGGVSEERKEERDQDHNESYPHGVRRIEVEKKKEMPNRGAHAICFLTKCDLT